MKQQREVGFIPFSYEKGRNRLIQKAKVCYSTLSNLEEGNASRHFLFLHESKGYTGACSYTHNSARFKSSKLLIPIREKAQQFQKAQKEKNAERRAAILGLKYGLKYGTITAATIERAKTAGIKIKRDNTRFIFSNAEVKRHLVQLFGSEMKGL